MMASTVVTRRASQEVLDAVPYGVRVRGDQIEKIKVQWAAELNICTEYGGPSASATTGTSDRQDYEYQSSSC